MESYLSLYPKSIEPLNAMRYSIQVFIWTQQAGADWVTYAYIYISLEESPFLSQQAYYSYWSRYNCLCYCYDLAKHHPKFIGRKRSQLGNGIYRSLSEDWKEDTGKSNAHDGMGRWLMLEEKVFNIPEAGTNIQLLGKWKKAWENNKKELRKH